MIKLQLKEEVNSAFNICRDLLIDFHGENLSFIYAKGSAMKNWDTLIDYVPVVSDIDLHYGVYDKTKLFQVENPREASLEVSLEYENRFNRDNPNKIHLPRTQIMCVDNLQNIDEFVHPLPSSVKMLYGEFPNHQRNTDEKIRSIDMLNLKDLKPYLDRLPDGWLDKVGLDYWSSIRQLTWRVSPSPVRVLTQLLPDPMTVWTWNRTRIMQELENQTLSEIAKMYEKYYLDGWKLFYSNLGSTQLYQNCMISGSRLVELCFKWYEHNNANNTN